MRAKKERWMTYRVGGGVGKRKTQCRTGWARTPKDTSNEHRCTLRYPTRQKWLGWNTPRLCLGHTTWNRVLGQCFTFLLTLDSWCQINWEVDKNGWFYCWLGKGGMGSGHVGIQHMNGCVLSLVLFLIKQNKWPWIWAWQVPRSWWGGMVLIHTHRQSGLKGGMGTCMLLHSCLVLPSPHRLFSVHGHSADGGCNRQCVHRDRAAICHRTAAIFLALRAVFTT